MQKLKVNKKTLYTALAVVVMALLLLVWLLNRSGLKVDVEPKTAIVSVDNVPIVIRNNGFASTTLSPGNHILAVEADGYISQIIELNLKRARTIDKEVSLQRIPKPYSISDSTEAAENVQFIIEGDDFNTVFYYADNAQTLYKAKFTVTDEGKIETVYNLPISNPPLSGIEKIIWSPKKDASIHKKGSKAFFFDFKKYNFVSQEEVVYGENIGDIAWSPDDSKIAYYYTPKTGERSLIFANKQNNNLTRVANLNELRISDPYLRFSPSSEWLIVIPRNSNASENKIYLFNAYTRSFKEVSDAGNNLEAKFSPDGSRILYSSYSDDPQNPVKSLVSIMDADGGNKRGLDLRADIDKIDWFQGSSEEIVVATWDEEKKTESIFVYNTEKKQKEGLFIELPEKKVVKEIVSPQNGNLIYYIANDQFYIVSLDN